MRLAARAVGVVIFHVARLLGVQRYTDAAARRLLERWSR